MQLPPHVEQKLKQLEFERNIANQERDEARKAVYTYMIIAILGWSGFILSSILEIIESGV